MAAEVWETPLPERVGEADGRCIQVAGKIAVDAQGHLAAAPPVHAVIGGVGVATDGRARILQLVEEALERAAKDLAVAKSALGGGAPGQDHARLRAGEAYDAAELCCDRLLLVNLLLDPRPRLPVASADDDITDDGGNERLRAANALEKAMGVAEDCASLVRAARQDASLAPASAT